MAEDLVTAAERALATIDDGLQSSTELGLAVAAPGYCFRCTVRRVGEGSDLCPPCRAFLLEDSDLDPRSTLTPEEVEAVLAFGRALSDALRPLLESIVEAVSAILDAAAPVLERFRPLFEHSAREELEARSLVPPGRLPQVGARRLPTIPTRDLRTTEAPRALPTPRRRRS